MSRRHSAGNRRHSAEAAVTTDFAKRQIVWWRARRAPSLFLTGEGVAVLLGLLQRGLQAADFALLCSELAGHLVQSPLQRLLTF